MKTRFLLLMMLATSISFGQVLEWATGTQGKGGVETYQVAIDSEGNVYSVGDFLDTIDVDPSDVIFELVSDDTFESYKLDGYIQKMDEDGNHIWAYRFGRYFDDAITAIITDDEDDLYIVGYFNDTVDFDFKDGVNEQVGAGQTGFVAKYDSDANLIWTYIYEPFTVLNDISQDSEDNICVTGNYGGNIFNSKLTSFGVLLWSHELGDGGAKGLAIDSDSENNIYISGEFDESVDFDPSDEEYIIEGEEFDDKAFFLKLNADGEFVWVKSVDPSNISVTDIKIDQNDNMYTTGSVRGEADMDAGPGVFNMIAPNNHTFVYKLNSDGDFLWMRYGRGTGASSRAKALNIDESNNVYVAGYFNQTLYMYSWVDDEVPPIESMGLTDMFIYHLTKDGNFISLHSFGGTREDGVDDISMNGDGDLFTCGYFQDTCNADPYGEGYDIVRDVTHSYSGYIQKINLSESVSIMEQTSINAYEIYPNPTENNLHIYSKNRHVVSVEVYGVDGCKWYSDIGANGYHLVNTESLPHGVYIVKITDAKGDVSTHKIIKN